jgi:tRNA threonylcarbamoyladenosine biosynthesis protein TsaE
MMTKLTLTQVEALGYKLGRALRGGECIELVGDVGTGKTTLTKNIARGLQIDEDVQSPSFTISRTYPARDGLELHHYDFYRLDDAGVVRHELAESINQPNAVTVIEWGGSVNDVLPEPRISIGLNHDEETTREFDIVIPDIYSYLQEAIK